MHLSVSQTNDVSEGRKFSIKEFIPSVISGFRDVGMVSLFFAFGDCSGHMCSLKSLSKNTEFFYGKPCDLRQFWRFTIQSATAKVETAKDKKQGFEG